MRFFTIKLRPAKHSYLGMWPSNQFNFETPDLDNKSIDIKLFSNFSNFGSTDEVTLRVAVIVLCHELGTANPWHVTTWRTRFPSSSLSLVSSESSLFWSWPLWLSSSSNEFVDEMEDVQSVFCLRLQSLCVYYCHHRRFMWSLWNIVIWIQ